jgi:hypothetical protein
MIETIVKYVEKEVFPKRLDLDGLQNQSFHRLAYLPQ